MRAYESFKNGINKRSRKEKLKEAEIDRMKNVIATLAEENLILKKNLPWIIGHNVKDKELKEIIKEEVKRMKELTGFKLEWILEKLCNKVELPIIDG